MRKMTQDMLRLGLLSLLLVGCSKKTGEEPESSTPITVPTPAEDEPKGSSLSRAECEAKGAKVVGDIGDGAIHRPDYVCESGKPPLGSIRPAEGEPIATEGEVCCP